MENKKLEKIDDRVGSPAMNGAPAPEQPEDKPEQPKPTGHDHRPKELTDDEKRAFVWVLIIFAGILNFIGFFNMDSEGAFSILFVDCICLLVGYRLCRKYKM